ncbi:MAG: glycosyltransferase family 39 protein [Candidatus Altiarchaeota archaeon]|nr:glycosyltransferase family 39 protein [Candidatus Altiarchaeota archaeon]
MDNVKKAFLAIVLLGLAVRLHDIDSKSAWFDEVFVVNHLKESLHDIAMGVGEEGHPPFYYLLAYFTGADTLLKLRFFSLFFGSLSIMLMYLTARELFGRAEGILSALMLALSYISVQNSQTARMYALAGFMLLATFYFLVKSLKTGSGKDWILFTLSLALMLYTHYFGLFLYAGLALFFLVRAWRNWKVNRAFGACLLVVLLVFSLHVSDLRLKVLLSTRQEKENFMLIVKQDPWTLQPDTGIYYILSGFSGTKYVMPLFVLLILYGLLRRYRSEKGNFEMLMLPLLTSFAGILLASSIMRVSIRHISYFIPLYLALAAAGLASIRDRRVYIAVLIVIVAASALKLDAYYKSSGPDWKSAVGFLNENTAKEDYILVEPADEKTTIRYYYTGPAVIEGITEFDNKPTKTLRFLEGHKDGRIFAVYATDVILRDGYGEINRTFQTLCRHEQRYEDIDIYLCNP